jgi:DNA-binding protein HU-beta
MNQENLIASISAKTNTPVDLVEHLLETTISTFKEQLVDDKIIGLQSFGNLEVQRKMEYIIVHPITQIRTLFPPKLVVVFKQSNFLKERLSKLPHNE